MTTDAPTATILLVEDDPATRTFLADNLCADGYEPLLAGSAREGMLMIETRYPDLAIVDVGLPDYSGLELLQTVRGGDGIASRADPLLPVIVLSGRGAELDRLRGFRDGADDYVVKPFAYSELHARVRAVLRRADERRGRGRLKIGTLEVDPAARRVRVCGAEIKLSAKEFALVRALAAEPTRVFSKEELMRNVWGTRALGTSRTLDSHACRLRRKLSIAGDHFIVNVWGVGYRLVDGPGAVAESTARVAGSPR
jgi:DNA-binding response OmpR family regulator